MGSTIPSNELERALAAEPFSLDMVRPPADTPDPSSYSITQYIEAGRLWLQDYINDPNQYIYHVPIDLAKTRTRQRVWNKGGFAFEIFGAGDDNARVFIDTHGESETVTGESSIVLEPGNAWAGEPFRELFISTESTMKGTALLKIYQIPPPFHGVVARGMNVGAGDEDDAENRYFGAPVTLSASAAITSFPHTFDTIKLRKFNSLQFRLEVTAMTVASSTNLGISILNADSDDSGDPAPQAGFFDTFQITNLSGTKSVPWTVNAVWAPTGSPSFSVSPTNVFLRAGYPPANISIVLSRDSGTITSLTCSAHYRKMKA